MVLISNGIWNLEAQSYKIQTNGSHFDKNHMKSRQMVTILTKTIWNPDKTSRFKKVQFWNWLGPFENQNISNPIFKISDFKCFCFLNGQILNLHCNSKSMHKIPYNPRLKYLWITGWLGFWGFLNREGSVTSFHGLLAIGDGFSTCGFLPIADDWGKDKNRVSTL